MRVRFFIFRAVLSLYIGPQNVLQEREAGSGAPDTGPGKADTEGRGYRSVRFFIIIAVLSLYDRATKPVIGVTKEKRVRRGRCSAGWRGGSPAGKQTAENARNPGPR
jgi:hypothetical protein